PQVALGDFRHSRQEIEALAIVKMKELCRMYSKRDQQERDTWRAVAQDVWETVGIGEERGEAGEEGGGEGGGVYDLKAHIDKLTDVLQEVKLQNNMKDEEIRALRDRMVRMENTLPSGQDDGMDDDDDEEGDEGGEEGEGGEGGAPKEVRVTRLMEEDAAFRRGRLRWLKQEQARLLNLQQQSITKKLRQNSQASGLTPSLAPSLTPGPTPLTPVHLPGTGRFIPPQDCKLKFPFKSNPHHRLSWGPATAAMLGLAGEEGGGEEGGEGQGGGKGTGSPPPPMMPPPPGQSAPLLPLPFQMPPPRMRTPSPHRAWQQRNQGNGNQGNPHFFQQHQQRYRRNSLDSSTHGNSRHGNHNNNGNHGGGGGGVGSGHQGRPRYRRGSQSPGAEPREQYQQRGGGAAGWGGAAAAVPPVLQQPQPPLPQPPHAQRPLPQPPHPQRPLPALPKPSLPLAAPPLSPSGGARGARGAGGAGGPRLGLQHPPSHEEAVQRPRSEKQGDACVTYDL
ncbi:kinesin-like protein KIF1C, partial [Osmerus mordax]|uniref:kinesin-like protein KIF1C n=1 Tax=Osmerus mordax TaxID=8014 RepID=UPI0035101746